MSNDAPAAFLGRPKKPRRRVPADAIDARKKAFVASLATGRSVASAADIAGVARASVYNWRRADAQFAEAWDDAVAEGTDFLEDEAMRRAVAGSDILLIFILKARRPEKYRETRRAVEVGSGRFSVILADAGSGQSMAETFDQAIAATTAAQKERRGE